MKKVGNVTVENNQKTNEDNATLKFANPNNASHLKLKSIIHFENIFNIVYFFKLHKRNSTDVMFICHGQLQKENI